jgi:DNA repair protein RecN (Recombination protein N)
VAAEDELLILRREVAAEGRNRAWVNNAAATAALVGELGRRLVDLHGQHEHQALLHAEEQRRVLDAYADASDLAARVRAAWQTSRDARARLEQLESRSREIAQRADYLRFQVEELQRASLRAGEDAELEVELGRLEHAEELARTSSILHQQIYAAENSITSRLDEARRMLEQLARIDPGLTGLGEPLESALYTLQEVGRDLGDYASGVERDPQRTEQVQRRLDLLYRLRAKYGPTLDDVLGALASAREELDALGDVARDRDALVTAQAEAEQQLQALASELGGRRRKAGKRLAKEMAALLPELGMGGRFEVTFTELLAPAAHGAEQIEFLIAVNAGFEPRPLARVASGGELSRVMLALRTALARSDGVPTLVFDEIDVGIGGRIANQVGEKLHDIARDHQVFVITHLAQIASRADHHLLVEKAERSGSTLTTVHELTGETRVQELARLLGGDPESEASREHARELLGSARS